MWYNMYMCVHVQCDNSKLNIIMIYVYMYTQYINRQFHMIYQYVHVQCDNSKLIYMYHRGQFDNGNLISI